MAHQELTRTDLIPAIVQDADDGRVLMLAYMDEEALRRTRETGEAWFWSRSRGELWHKGETSGNTLAVVELRDDCDGDAILLLVRPAGPVCHTGSLSCFAPWLWRRVHSSPIVPIASTFSPTATCTSRTRPESPRNWPAEPSYSSPWGCRSSTLTPRASCHGWTSTAWTV